MTRSRRHFAVSKVAVDLQTAEALEQPYASLEERSGAVQDEVVFLVRVALHVLPVDDEAAVLLVKRQTVAGMAVAGGIAFVVVDIGHAGDAVVLFPHVGDEALGRAQRQADVLLRGIALEMPTSLLPSDIRPSL
jgi:hypothetical protein